MSSLIAPRTATVTALVAHARRVPSLRREALAADLAALGPSDGLIVVRTCHRVEAYLGPGAPGDLPLPEAPPGTDVLHDADAAHHLISVACGLDSVVLGEDQILHQLRSTLAERHAERSLHPVLDRLFQVALRAGRRARTWFSGPPRSLADVALDRIEREAGPLEGRTILVVGAGRMGRLAALAAGHRGAQVLVANRSLERATALAREVGGAPLPFMPDRVMPPLDGAILAIGGEWQPGRLAARGLAEGRAVVVDLSSPPAVAAGLQADLGARYVSVDDLATAPEAASQDRLRRRLDALVLDTGRDYCRWLRARETVPAIHGLTEIAEERRRVEMEWLVRHLPELGEEERAIVEQMSHRLVAGILHGPLVALNGDTDGELAVAARELFGLAGAAAPRVRGPSMDGDSTSIAGPAVPVVDALAGRQPATPADASHATPSGWRTRARTRSRWTPRLLPTPPPRRSPAATPAVTRPRSEPSSPTATCLPEPPCSSTGRRRCHAALPAAIAGPRPSPTEAPTS